MKKTRLLSDWAKNRGDAMSEAAMGRGRCVSQVLIRGMCHGMSLRQCWAQKPNVNLIITDKEGHPPLPITHITFCSES